MFFNDPALRELKRQFVSEKIRKEGIVRASDRGFGFLEVGRDEAYFIAPADMRRVLHGDRVSAVLENEDDGRQRAVPQSLVECSLKRFVGQVLYTGGRLSVIPDLPSVKTKIPCDDRRAEASAELKNGDWVVCELTAHALRQSAFRGEISEFIAAKTDPRVPWNVSLRRYDLPLSEPEDRDFPFLEGDLPREDLTRLPFVTIDSEHTEDMDDALYIEKGPGGFRLWVAIADPTGYIAENSELDAYAARRGFSIYLPGRDIPMLPRVLSQDLCSLRAGETRPAVVGVIACGPDGTLDPAAASFRLATIKSRAKLAYNAVSDYLEHRADAAAPEDAVAAVLGLLAEFTEARGRRRRAGGAWFRDRPDYDFILTPEGALDHIEVNFRRIANRIVEEAMIAANICAGEALAAEFGRGVFNTHSGFDKDKKDEILALLESEGCPVPPDGCLSLEGYNQIRRFACGTGANYMDCRIRRLQAYSQLSAVPAPHFALGVPNYATWTSPIRKYGDMVNHRLLKALIAGTKHPALPGDELLAGMNQARRVNRMVERDVRDWLYVDYLKPEIEKGTVFTGEVFEINRGGIRAVLEENGAMVFIPVPFITENRGALTLDGDTGCLYAGGERALRLGDTLALKIFEVSGAARTITAVPAEPVAGLPLPDPRRLKVGPGGRRR